MRAVFRLSRRYVARRFLQSLLFVLGVALGVAMVIAIDLANSSASRAFNLSTESITGKATHRIAGGPAGLPTEVYTRLRLELGLREAAPVIAEYVRGVELGDQPLRLFGVDTFAEPPFRSYLTAVQVDGGSQAAFDALNAFIAEPNTILMSQSLADRFGVRAGDTVTLRAGNARVTVRVIGLLQPEDRLSAQAIDDLLLTDIATAQEIVGRPGAITRVDLILPPDYDLSRIEALLPPGAALVPAREEGALSQMTAAFELNLQALSLLALVVGVFLIYNTVTFSVVQRRPVLGTLRALGATRRQVFALILGEALILGAVGTVLGLGLGIIFGRAAVGLVAQTISDLYFTVNVQGVAVDPFTLAKGAAVGLGASLLTAVIPSYAATTTPPAGTLRRSDFEQRSQRLVPLVTLAALALIAVGLLLLNLPTTSLVIGFGGLFAVVIGGALFTPAALVALMQLAVAPGGRLFGVLGRMAPRAVARSLSRTSVAVAALTVAVSVIVGVSVMIDSFRGSVADWLDTTLGADIYISPPLLTANRATVDVDPAIVNDIAALPGVARVVTSRQVSVLAPDYPDLPPVNLNTADSDVTASQRRFAWLSVPYDDYFAALDAGGVIVSEPFAFRRGITPENNALTLLTDRGPRAFKVLGVYYDYTTDQGAVLMSDHVYRQFYDDPYISSIALFLDDGVNPADVIAALQRETLVGTDLQAQDNRTLRAGVFEVFERAFAITIALRLLATVVAFIGILSALLALQLEQARAYGVMRATGLTPRQLWQYTLLQTGLMGGTAGLLALPIGLVLAVVLVFSINVRSFGWTMQLAVAPSELVVAFLVALVAALAAGVYPAWHLGRMQTARALRGE
ncbi:MAG: FtsX-like permease family protein [Aggregatilineales bacterium]